MGDGFNGSHDGSFRALRIHQRDGRIQAAIERLTLADLSAGEVVIRVSHSGINYKDALAATGAGRILRRYPLVGGIDLAGTVAQSTDPALREGDAVLVTGCGLSETRDGGYAQFARVPAEAVVPLPAGLSAPASMAIGTAGFAAAIAIERMETNGQTPAHGPVVVTGASGGVGSLAIDLLAGRGYEVVALTGKREAEGYLRALGAAQLLWRDELSPGTQPLESARWGGAIDNAGGAVLSWLLRGTREHGNVAAIGLAAGAELHTTVMPFILRGVSLLGVNSSTLPRAHRLALWSRLASDLRPRHLDRIVTREIELAALPEAFADYISAGVIGRTVVRVGQQT
ncbi:MAG TPA: oxidoreductase [Steroidobacteraceae bacterium]|jgi:NADPH2:quinone reductase|nr:oxidoreductase [Steroidobacteraceae bacterium]